MIRYDRYKSECKINGKFRLGAQLDASDIDYVKNTGFRVYGPGVVTGKNRFINLV